jgi:formate C-acetyltransferase
MLKQAPIPPRLARLKAATLAEPRRVSVEQARIITASYRQTEGLPAILRRAEAFRECCRQMPIRVDPDELIVGNRTPGIRAGVVFPEASVAWIERELDSLPTRPQDPFAADAETKRVIREEIVPAWKGRTLEDTIYGRFDAEITDAARAVKINQRDHAQGHIIPDLRRWLALGPAGIQAEAVAGKTDLHRAVVIAMDGARTWYRRYAEAAAEREGVPLRSGSASASAVAAICSRLADHPPQTFHEAVQATWMLFVLLHLESNASSFSLGRLDQVLWPFYEREPDKARAAELIGALFIKCNQIVYLRNAHSAEYFAGFPIGFNIAIGGVNEAGKDATNELSYLFLQAQSWLLLPQPNLSARLHAGSPPEFLAEVTRVIGQGSGMPQVFNDEAVIPALQRRGISERDARDYAVVGCVELSTQGNLLGWSDAAMFNLVKALELALNDGVCLLTGQRMGPATGTLADHATFADVERAFTRQLEHFLGVMFRACAIVEQVHAEKLPSPFLSAVIDGCLERGVDVTAGGARYNLSGIQAIQAANIADALAVLKWCYGTPPSVAATSLAKSTATATEGGVPAINRVELLAALRANWAGHEDLRRQVMECVPKFGNDVPWVDKLAGKWTQWFADQLTTRRNWRGGPYHMGLYTVSAHMPMGRNCGASPDGRRAGEPLADGGVSPMTGRDARGPTAVLQSVARLPFGEASNGTLLNMKFLPQMFANEQGRDKFAALLRGWCRLGITHAQFNVLRREDLLAAKRDPEKYRHLIVRVAGYSAYFVELAGDLQDEIIARTAFGDGG